MGVTFDDLVERNDLYYEKFTDAPFTGEVTGKEHGSIENGKREGAWVTYYENGQLWYKGDYKSGKQEGAWVSYHKTGKLKSKGNFKNGKATGAWVGYLKDGTVFKDWTGTFKDGKKISD